MEIKDLTNFEELTISETSKVIGGKKTTESIEKIKKAKGINIKGARKMSCNPIDWIYP